MHTFNQLFDELSHMFGVFYLCILLNLSIYSIYCTHWCVSLLKDVDCTYNKREMWTNFDGALMHSHNNYLFNLF